MAILRSSRETQVAWGRRLGDEFWASVVSPLSYSLLAEVMAEHMVRRPLRAAGLGRLSGEPVFRRFAGRVYVNMDLAERILSLVPRPLRAPGLVELLPPRLRERLLRSAPVHPSLLLALGLLSWRDPKWLPFRHQRLFDEAAAEVERRFGGEVTAASLRGCPKGELYRMLSDLRDPLGRYLETVVWVVGFGYLIFHLTRGLVEEWASAGGHLVWSDLIVGLEAPRSFGAARELAALGELPTGGDSSQALAGILLRHGHRMIGRDLAMPSWREAPAVVLALARKSACAALFGNDRLARRIEAESKLMAAVPSRAKRMVLDRLLPLCRRYCGMREEMRYVADYFLARMRAVALALGARLTEEGSLEQTDDIFYLDLAELESAVSGDRRCGRRAQARKQEEERWREASAPEFLFAGEAVAPRQPPGVVLRGEAASLGRVEGRACVVRVPGDVDSIEPGDVVVANYVDPSWGPALAAAAALALESAGQLSHGAILARELGIPALVNVSGATALFRTGDPVVLDATRGTLSRL